MTSASPVELVGVVRSATRGLCLLNSGLNGGHDRLLVFSLHLLGLAHRELLARFFHDLEGDVERIKIGTSFFRSALLLHVEFPG